MTHAQVRATATDAGIIFSGQHSTDPTTARGLCRAAKSGSLVRVSRGAFVDAKLWSGLFSADKLHLTVLASALLMSQDTVFSHESAASLLGIQILGTWRQQITVTVRPEDGIRSTPTVRRIHAPISDGDIVSVGGLRCTSPARTIADLASSRSFVDAVSAADSALHRKRQHQLLTLDELAHTTERMTGRRGHQQALRVLDFATPLSDSVQESRSRVLIYELGFPAPVLQQQWRDHRGFIGETDFWWPAYKVVGEFDGLVKYLERGMRGNRTAEQVVVAEKKREDRIRRMGQSMARWVTAELNPPSQLRTILLGAALPLLR